MHYYYRFAIIVDTWSDKNCNVAIKGSQRKESSADQLNGNYYSGSHVSGIGQGNLCYGIDIFVVSYERNSGSKGKSFGKTVLRE